MADETQNLHRRLLAYLELTYSAIAVYSFAEASDGLLKVRQIALADETFERFLLLRCALNGFQRIHNALEGIDDKTARKLQCTLSEWLEEIEEALEVLKEESSLVATRF